MTKPYTLKSLGPLRISFEYEIAISDHIFKDSYAEFIHGVKKEDVNDEYLERVLNEKMMKIINSIRDNNPSLFPEEEMKIHCQVNNYTHGFFEMDLHIDFKK